MIATVSIKGLLRILGLFYNDTKDTKKGEESKQPIKLRSFFKLRHIILTLTPAILRIDNF